MSKATLPLVLLVAVLHTPHVLHTSAKATLAFIPTLKGLPTVHRQGSFEHVTGLPRVSWFARTRGKPWWRAHTQRVPTPVLVMAFSDGTPLARAEEAQGKGMDKTFSRSDAVRVRRLRRSRGILFELQAGRTLSSRLATGPAGEPLPLATHGGTWNIELRPTSIEEGLTGVAYESPAFTLAGDFRFRLIATVLSEVEETRVGLFVRYIGRMVGDQELRVSDDGEVMTELAIPIIRCSARKLEQPELPWVSSQAISFTDPTAFQCGIDDFATIRAGDEHIRLEFRIDLLSVHYPGSSEAEELRGRSWETIVQAAEKALTEGSGV